VRRMGRLGADALAALGRRHLAAIATVGGENSTVAGEVDARIWDQGGELGDAIDGLRMTCVVPSP